MGDQPIAVARHRRSEAMVKRSPHHRSWGIGRRIAALATVFALIMAPIIVILTHGPAAHATAVDGTDEGAAHGHGHDHGDTGAGPLNGHDASDHEHQLHALVGKPLGFLQPMADAKRCAASLPVRGLTRDGPERPPRFI